MSTERVTVEFRECRPPEKCMSPQGPRSVCTRMRVIGTEGQVLVEVGAAHYLTEDEKSSWTAKLLDEVSRTVKAEMYGKEAKQLE